MHFYEVINSPSKCIIVTAICLFCGLFFALFWTKSWHSKKSNKHNSCGKSEQTLLLSTCIVCWTNITLHWTNITIVIWANMTLHCLFCTVPITLELCVSHYVQATIKANKHDYFPSFVRVPNIGIMCTINTRGKLVLSQLRPKKLSRQADAVIQLWLGIEITLVLAGHDKIAALFVVIAINHMHERYSPIFVLFTSITKSSTNFRRTEG